MGNEPGNCSRQMGIHKAALSAVERSDWPQTKARICVLVCDTRDAFSAECFGFRSRFDEQGGGRIAVKVCGKAIDGALEDFALEEMRCERVLLRY
jgi:hypothetical protein